MAVYDNKTICCFMKQSLPHILVAQECTQWVLVPHMWYNQCSGQDQGRCSCHSRQDSEEVDMSECALGAGVSTRERNMV